MNVSTVRGALDLLAPSQAFDPQWEDVLARAEEVSAATAPPRRRSRVSRRVVLALAVLAAVLIPLAALAAANDWWFLRFGQGPTPATDVAVVRTGSWGDQEWQLVAYRSTSDDVCFSFTPASEDARGTGAGMSCSSIEPHGITFLSGSTGSVGYIVGPVTESAREVEISFTSGEKLRAKTFDVPDSLGDLRFYAAQLPASANPSLRPAGHDAFPRKLVGLDANGRIVACLVDPMDGTESLSTGCQ